MVVPRADAASAFLRSFSAQKCAHKGLELGNAVRTQGWNQAVMCGVVLRNSVPRVHNRDLHAKGASGTIRCIKTPARTRSARRSGARVRGHPAPSGAFAPLLRRGRSWSSTQVPSRCCGGASCGRAVSAPPVSFCSVVRTQGPRIRQRCSHTRAELSRCVRCCVA